MFTGIVEETGEVVAATDDAGGRRLRIAADEVATDLHHGQSISVSGVCLTVEDWGPVADLAHETDAGDTWFEVFLAEETTDVTYLGDVEAGHVVNLERAMPADGRLDGHVVQGHVDTATTVADVEQVGDDWRFVFDVPPGYGKYVAEKGSVALDGISLTVAERTPDTFEVAIIPATYDLTNFSEKAPGDPVHVEIDVLARYAERLLADRERAEVPVKGVDPGEAVVEDSA
jgi:riboflavin synthase